MIKTSENETTVYSSQIGYLTVALSRGQIVDCWMDDLFIFKDVTRLLYLIFPFYYYINKIN